MATAYKVLGMTGAAGSFGNGAETLTATANKNVYTVPASKAAVVSSIIICNQAASSATYRIAVRPGGTAADSRHWIVYGATVAASDSTVLTLGLTLATTDIVTVYASASTLSFSLYGSELDA